MSRESEFNTLKSPAKKFISWAGKHETEGSLTYYDKTIENKEDRNIRISNYKFAVLLPMHSVTGYNDNAGEGIFANDVQDITKDALKVRLQKSKSVLAEGTWKEIKPIVDPKGAKYAKVLYVMNSKGEIDKLEFKGSGVAAWSEFEKENKGVMTKHWIGVTSSEKLKKGSNEYFAPVFKLEAKLGEKGLKGAEMLYDEVKTYVAVSTNDSAVSPASIRGGKTEQELQNQAEQESYVEEHATAPSDNVDLEDDLPF